MRGLNALGALAECSASFMNAVKGHNNGRAALHCKVLSVSIGWLQRLCTQFAARQVGRINPDGGGREREREGERVLCSVGYFLFWSRNR